MNKIFILLSLLSSLTIAMPGDAEKPIEIEAESVVVDQSHGGEIFKSNKPTSYQSKISNIKSQGMYYDVVSQRIELIGEVVGLYE